MKEAIPAAVLEQHLGILGKTGRGKTNTAKVCVEQVYDEDFRVCILDTIKSDWWGLTASADGRRPGLPFYILGGPHAHLPLSSGSGKTIAELVARGQLRHTILDMADFEPGGQMRFFVDFAPKLMQRMKGVLYLVIEEAHILAPKERAGMGHENMSIHWAKMLATAGRTKGIRLIVLSQRTQALHNAVIGSCDSMIVHGMTAPADMKPVLDWLKANSKDQERNLEIATSLSGLPKGTGWLCSGEAGVFERREFPLARTFDNTKTPENDNELEEVRTAKMDIEALRSLLGNAAAEVQANDPAILRKRIAELEMALRRQPAGESTDQVMKRLGMARQAGYEEGATAARKEARDNARDQLSTILGLVDDLREKVSRHYLAYNATQPDPPAAHPGNGAEPVSNRLVPAEEMNAFLAEGLEQPTGLKAKILATLRWLEMRGMQPAPRAALGGIADFTPDKGYGARMLGEMKTAELITYPVPGTVELTGKGRRLAPEPPAYRSMFEAWQQTVSGLHREVLDLLHENHPTEVTRTELGEVLKKQFEKGYGARVLGELKTMGAIEYPTPGTLRLTRYVIPE